MRITCLSPPAVSRTFEHQVRSLKERIAAMVAERQEATTRAQGEVREHEHGVFYGLHSQSCRIIY